jgi:hypothetical protein
VKGTAKAKEKEKELQRYALLVEASLFHGSEVGPEC